MWATQIWIYFFKNIQHKTKSWDLLNKHTSTLWMLSCFSHVQLLANTWDSPGLNPGASCHAFLQGSSQPRGWTCFTWDSPGLNPGAGCHAFLQGSPQPRGWMCFTWDSPGLNPGAGCHAFLQGSSQPRAGRASLGAVPSTVLACEPMGRGTRRLQSLG